ncbi:hypothetical protein ALC57_17859 [Trachymyrmex cornetzi]|uniref:Endonuclease/exonuclease/phosphatase domain-containing protein n=1 Tax=Trachymyrmex cornetzi TaxID=471704 RepID=A0A151IT12_9HYME|nr:hypothetical protein ALC57_17859 [Trachymyrmex cornetzi]
MRGGGKEEVEGMMAGMMRVGDNRLRIVGVYVNMNLESKLENIKEWMKSKEERIKTVIGEDFNARTGREGERIREENEEKEWSILNGNVKRDEKGNWTYTGERGDSVIDYVLVDEETREGIESMEIGEEIDSDHHPLVVSLRGGREQTGRGQREGRGERQVGEYRMREIGRYLDRG